MENKEVLNSHLESQLREYTKKYKEERGKADRRYDYLTIIAEKICSSVYGEQQLGGKNKVLSMSDMELRDFIIKDHLEQRARYIDSINQLQKMYLASQTDIQILSEKIVEQKKELEEKEKEIFELRSGGSVPLNQQIETSYDPETGEIIETPLSQVEQKRRQVNENKDVILIRGEVVDLAAIENNLSENEKVALRAVGEKGYSDTADLMVFIKDECKVKDTYVRQLLSELTKKNLLVSDPAATVLNPRRQMFSLTKLGKAVYKRLYDLPPVVCEKERLAQMHATLRHGICIKDTATILENLGYTNVSYDEKANTINVSGNQRYVPDVIAQTDKGEKTFWEVELGHHKDVDFFDKLDKAARVSKEVYIIAPKEEERVKLKRQIAAYKSKKMMDKIQNEKGENAGIKLTVYLGTMKQLMDRNIFTSENCKYIIR